MGRIFGIILKNNEDVKTEKIIYAPFPDENYFITELLPPIDGYSSSILNSSELSDSNKEWFKLSTGEINALIYNDTYGSADETIRYNKSINEPFSPYFKAIKLINNSDTNKINYSDEFKEFENWVEPKTMKSALYKLTTILYEQLKQQIKNQTDESNVKTGFDNLMYLYNAIDILSKMVKFDKIALISYQD